MGNDYKDCKHIGHDFRMIHNGISKFFSNCENPMEEFGFQLTHSQCGIVSFLYAHQDEDVFQKDLEAYFQISGATASNTLKGMEKQGAIERIPMPEDARKKKLVLTDRGRKFHEAAVDNLEALDKSLTRGMDSDEVARYRAYLHRTIQNLDELTGFCCEKK